MAATDSKNYKKPHENMNIVVDTSVLRNNRGFLNSGILLMKKLSKLELPKIHISWIVYKESISQNLIEVDSGINAVKDF